MRAKRIKFLERELKRMSAPNFYGSWCSGYIRAAYQAELEQLRRREEKEIELTDWEDAAKQYQAV